MHRKKAQTINNVLPQYARATHPLHASLKQVIIHASAPSSTGVGNSANRLRLTLSWHQAGWGLAATSGP